jgi:hypothetical protein
VHSFLCLDLVLEILDEICAALHRNKHIEWRRIQSQRIWYNRKLKIGPNCFQGHTGAYPKAVDLYPRIENVYFTALG